MAASVIETTAGGGMAKARSRVPLASAGVVIGLLLVGACASTRPAPAPVRVSEIVKMSKEGVPPRTIIEKMRASRTVYRLKADQLARLSQEGVPDAVLNYMQQTYIRAVRRNQTWQDWGYWRSDDGGFWYGGRAFGWPNDADEFFQD